MKKVLKSRLSWAQRGESGEQGSGVHQGDAGLHRCI